MATKLDKNAIEAINNYGDRIKTLKDFVAAVRKRPGMYIGPLNSRGLLNMMREIFQNAVDQILDPTSPANWFSFYYDERTLEVAIEDNGLGFPFDDIIRILTKQHTSKNYEKKPFDYSSGLNGIGSKVVNALSSTFIVESYRYDGKAVREEFVKGYPTTNKPKSIPNKEKKQGSKIMFVPDAEILGDMNLEWRTVYTLIKNIMSLTPIGTFMDFEAIDIKGKRYTERIINKDGLVTNLIMNVKFPINKPIVLSADDGFHKVECAFCYDAGDGNGPDSNAHITAFSNFCPTTDGTHIEGCLSGISRWFVQYMNNIYLANQKSKSKLKVNSSDIENGLNIMISAAHLEPNFTGQAKETLSNEDMVGFCKEVMMKGLDDWAKSNPQDLNKLSKFFKDMAEARQKMEDSKTKIAAKYHKNPISDLPAKYKRPLKNDNVELIIVEGDSALGTVELARDPNCQGLFPIRGKIANAFKKSKHEFFSNAEVQAITRIILGSDYKKFTIEDVKVSKIIIMADADIDGAHIAALLERMFVMYFPQIIEAGMLYKAIPPLYSIKEGKKSRFFTEQIDIVKFIQKAFLNNNTFTDLKRNPLSNKEVTLFFLRNADYVYNLSKIANTYAIDPYLLEMVLFNYVENKRKFDYTKLKKAVKSAYRFMDVYKENGIIIVKGEIDKSNFVICNDKFIADCYDILKIIEENTSLRYLINNKVSTIYSIMLLYQATTPAKIQRYKGLGEMDEDELAESTLYPGLNRTLVRYTMDDIKETLNTIREFESNSKKILNEVSRVTRDDLLD
jgi:DNA gyrase subunit B